MVTIVCFKWGTEFGPEYVNYLYNSIKRNTTLDFKFICYTENPSGVECETREFLEPLPHWWYIIGLFNSSHGFTDKVIYMDLDTIILDNIDHILSIDKPFLTLRDYYRPKGLQTAYIAWQPAWGAFVWDRLKEQFPRKNYDQLLTYRGGTNRFLEESVGLGPEVPRLQDLVPEECVSYKVHIRDKREACDFSKVKMVFFHGKPRPHEVTQLDWMQKHWR
jgi:hypothetical protein